jgi:hypothetical protein
MKIVPVDLGCRISDPSGEILLQDGFVTYLLFGAVSTEPDQTGRLRDLGMAVLACEGCVVSKFGYPNDEGLPEHPLYRFGLQDVESSAFEVVDSEWVQEVAAQCQASRKRIWGEARAKAHAPGVALRHFVMPLKEATFECIAERLSVSRFLPTSDKALAYVRTQMQGG